MHNDTRLISSTRAFLHCIAMIEQCDACIAEERGRGHPWGRPADTRFRLRQGLHPQ